MKRWAISLMVMVALLVTAIPLVSGEALTGGHGSGDMVGPATDGTWIQANTDGFGDPNNRAITSMTVFNGHLYAGTDNPDTGGEIWRTADGTTWSQVNFDGFGNPNNRGISHLLEFQGYLYAGVWNEADGGQIWRSTDGTTWSQVIANGFGDANNWEVFRFATFNGALYASTWNEATGTEIWRSSDGTTWSQVNADGFGDVNNQLVPGLKDLTGYLYAGTVNRNTGADLWRTADGTTWTQVNADGFGDPDNIYLPSLATFGIYLYAGTQNNTTAAQLWRSPDGTSWSQVMGNGFGDPNNRRVESLIAFGGYLYGVTSNWVTGMEVWRTANGINWAQVNADGFGDANNRCGYWGNSVTVFNSNLYLGSYNPDTGGEVWRMPITIPFTDISPDDWFYEAVMNLYNRGIVSGYPDGTFRPSSQVTRAEFSTMLVRAMRWAIDTSGGPHFTDVSPGAWYYDFVETAYNRGMVSGYPDGTFRPDNPITRAEIATMVVRAMGWAMDTSGAEFPDVPVTHWAYGYVKTARNHGVVSGYPDGTFKPDNPSTRAEAAAMIYRAVP